VEQEELRELRAELGELRRFIDRRFAELSTEVHGAVQMVDYSESNLAGMLARLQEQIGPLLAAPAAATRNSGLELEAVVQATEGAAHRIMEAAEAIAAWVETGADREAMESVSARIGAIFEACTFQDLTGQRIRRAIRHLETVETMLAGMVPGAPPSPPAGMPAGEETPDLGQAEIDRLLA
jgi:chemotaxis protein CheZ